jgi:methylated-DNA-[protein]-cysteine S-methyltransferase
MRSPVGRLTLVAKGDALVALVFEGGEESTWRWLERRFGKFQVKGHPDSAGAVSALRAYFGGDLTALDRVKVDTGGTEFQRSV